MARLFKQFSFPGGIGVHVTPETPGCIHEGGELGYALSHAYGAAFDSPGPRRVLRRRRRRGRDRSARGRLARQQVPRARGPTAPSSRSCTSTATRSPTRRSSPGSREDELIAFFRGYGYDPIIVAGDDPAAVHRLLAVGARPGARRDRRDPAPGPRRRRRRAPELADDRPPDARRAGPARRTSTACRPRAAGAPTRSRSATSAATTPTCALLESWLRSYRPEELFDERGAPDPDIARPVAARRPPDERQPDHATRAGALPRTSSCPTSGIMPSGRPEARCHDVRGDPGPRRAGCATSSRPTRRRSGSSGPTRPRRTGWAPSSR